MNAFDVLGDPVRRRILELLAETEQPAGAVSDVISTEFGISQAAVSQHLKILRETGFATSTIDGTRRIYAIRADGLKAADAWLDKFRTFWEPKFMALETEIERGKKQRRDRD
ncbi:MULTISPECIES: ArsR/SmtB family transcription factor [Henriciella]|jgi:DNA-binding transcriptional ArsR family regulator|uniref:Transcriptional regulator n=1 Tax=Henriciella pelagia TaxID=1977912 RepID=A0ABQ1JG56_9PROT|nr:metalloregulator ArsR/SmtB family transcription factor [Henriciella pelagia]GGB66355.1 transcriptional regulator [Henriciella pelagia]